MNERSNAERAEAVTKYTVEIRSINEDGAIRLRDWQLPEKWVFQAF